MIPVVAFHFFSCLGLPSVVFIDCDVLALSGGGEGRRGFRTIVSLFSIFSSLDDLYGYIQQVFLAFGSLQDLSLSL